ncbi:MAG TPA: hypothetical protein DCM87_02030 [Planctomycetes bacterium]|nr:hypothetical protein [Planctomycetota bacterium]
MTTPGNPRATPDPLILTLDAGGTNFVFNAIKGSGLVLDAGVVLPAEGRDLPRSLANLIRGFREVGERTRGLGPPAAASFAFPGPADYRAGVIGELENMPAYGGAVPLAAVLREALGVPVFINNDGDLFACGAARYGELRELDGELRARGSARRLTSLAGMTIGTGWGCGFVADGVMFIGSSSTGMEIGACPYIDGRAIEETVSAGGLVRLFREELGPTPFPFDADEPGLPERIAALARGGRGAAAPAAERAFRRLGEALAFGLNWAIDLLDPDLVVIGGGLAGAWDLTAPRALACARSAHVSGRARGYKRLFDLGDEVEREEFLRDETSVMEGKKTGIARSRLGTAEAIMRGAYDFALRALGIDAAP